jgi:actin-related protein
MSLAVQSVVQQMFCGDEVKAAVVDLGGSCCRFGFAGQETPRYRFRSEVGIIKSESGKLNGASSSSASSSSRHSNFAQMDVDQDHSESMQSAERKFAMKSGYVVGDQNFRSFHSEMDIRHPFRGELLHVTASNVEQQILSSSDSPVSIDWDAVEALMRYGTAHTMSINPSEYPILFAENNFTSVKDKTKLMELCYESLDVPATWIADNAVLAAFSGGRPTALVIDFGASGTRVTPVVDGYALNRARICTQRGGDQLDSIVSAALAARGIAVKPWFDAPLRTLSDFDSITADRKGHLTKTTKGSKTSPRAKGSQSTNANNNHSSLISKSLRFMHTMDVIRDVKKWMSFVPYIPVPAENRENFITNVIQLPAYELPDGTVVKHSDELCTGMENMFFSSAAASLNAACIGLPAFAQPIEIHSNTSSLPDIVRASVLRSDIDCRKDLLANICLVGGGSLIDGVSARLTHELTELLPTHLKAKINIQLPDERLNAAWIGGSILSICGSFQQMWISKQEWDEYGDTLFAHRLH